MIAEFLHRVTTKIRKIGQTKVCARLMNGLFINRQIIVAWCGG
ncbi:MAG: hypothetical protein WCH85_06915 [Methanomicrobiales archaeon]